MNLMRACDCYAIYCEHNPMPFPKHGKWDGTLWVLFARFQWYRRLRGGVWQQFDGRAISTRPPYPIWLQVTKRLRDALKTEDYQRPQQERKEERMSLLERITYIQARMATAQDRWREAKGLKKYVEMAKSSWWHLSWRKLARKL